MLALPVLSLFLLQECGGPPGDVYPSILLSPVTASPPPIHSHPHTLTPPHCIEIPLMGGRLEPGATVCTKLVMQGASLLSNQGEVPLHLLFYYEPAILSANSRLRYTHTPHITYVPHISHTPLTHHIHASHFTHTPHTSHTWLTFRTYPHILHTPFFLSSITHTHTLLFLLHTLHTLTHTVIECCVTASCSGSTSHSI